MTKAYSYIRMSTDAQLLGDSLRRQVERTSKFAADNGLVLDDTFNLHDIGLSAYDGSNVEKGQLGKFLQAVKTGRIERGSYLVVESLDRLSRQTPRQALRVFLDLLDSGISVATLVDRRIYTPESGDQMDLMMSIALMVRAHDESLHKSDRLTAVWKNKRETANSRIVTAKCKAWVRPLTDRTGFELIPERVAVVRRIFAESADSGIGADSIARRLNLDGISVFGGSRGWHKSYVLKILTDRATIGEFQPHRMSKGRRVPEGESLPGYYPAVVDPDLFYRAQAALARRKIAGGGRRGDRVSNLFSKLAKCGQCDARMTFVNKGGKSGKSLVCDGARRGLGCHAPGWSYPDLERSILTFVDEIDLNTIAGPEGSADSDLVRLQSELQEVEGRLVIAQRQRDRILTLILGDEPTDYLAARLREQDRLVAELAEGTEAAKSRISTLLEGVSCFTESRGAIGSLVKQVQSDEGSDSFRTRSAIAAKLRNIIDEIIVWSGPCGPNAATQAALRGWYGAERTVAATPPGWLPRTYFVRFKDGHYRLVSPDPKAPDRFEMISDSRGVAVTAAQFDRYARERYGKRLEGADYSRAYQALRDDAPNRARYRTP